MPPKPESKPGIMKSVVMAPSNVQHQEDIMDNSEETEITAQIMMPNDGGWGWLVVAASFSTLFVLDGVAFTFGSIYADMKEDLNKSETLIAFINSLAMAIYLMGGPLASALVNRFGFRACTMCGAIISSFALFFTVFLTTYSSVLFFYGVVAGFGYCLINLAACLVVGFYFEKMRAIAISIATNGSSLGIMILFPLNTELVKLVGWRIVTLVHSGLFGMIFFFGMAYKPLLSLTVTKTDEEPTKTVTFVPHISTPNVVHQDAKPVIAKKNERMMGAVSNVNFPTAANMFDERPDVKITTAKQAGPSTAAPSKLTITAITPQKGISQRQVKQVQSIKSRTGFSHQPPKQAQKPPTNIVEITADQPRQRKKKKWYHCCQWEEHIQESRPMYRDDAFYAGKVENLEIYKKSVMEIPTAERTGLEYQLAVSRAVTTNELQERRGVFTTACRRVLATMMDPSLLSRTSFKLFACAGLTLYVGYLIPYVFVKERNILAGVAANHCSLLVSLIGFANAVGRITLGVVATKVDPSKLFALSCLVAGIATMASGVYYTLAYQYGCWFVFGFFIASLSSLRSVVIVELYGLDKLTSATGMVLMFQGIGSLMGTPVASELRKMFGFDAAFYFAGCFIIISGFLVFPIKSLSVRESKANRK